MVKNETASRAFRIEEGRPETYPVIIVFYSLASNPSCTDGCTRRKSRYSPTDHSEEYSPHQGVAVMLCDTFECDLSTKIGSLVLTDGQKGVRQIDLNRIITSVFNLENARQHFNGLGINTQVRFCHLLTNDWKTLEFDFIVDQRQINTIFSRNPLLKSLSICHG